MNGGAWLGVHGRVLRFIYRSAGAYGSYGTPPASEHGLAVDQLMNFNMAIIFVVFFIVNTLLFWFSAKYYHRADRKATFHCARQPTRTDLDGDSFRCLGRHHCLRTANVE